MDPLKAPAKAKVNGNSMSPYIKHGDEIDMWPIDDVSKLRFGDIIVFKEGERLVCHILIKLMRKSQDSDLYFITQGLNQSHEDYPIPSRFVFARTHKCPWYYLLLLQIRNFVRVKK